MSTNKRTWTEEIVSAFQELGGIIRYKELYSYFSSKNIKEYNAKKDGAAQIRGAIELHSRASFCWVLRMQIFKEWLLEKLQLLVILRIFVVFIPVTV